MIIVCLLNVLLLQASFSRIVTSKTGSRSSGEGLCSMSGLSGNQVRQETHQVGREFCLVHYWYTA